MASPKSNSSLYPEVILSNPEASSAFSTSSPSPNLYPSIDTKDLPDTIFQDDAVSEMASSSQQPSEEVLIRVPGAIVHLIERDRSVELACGVLEIVSLKQGETVVAVLARVGDEIQWPLARDEAAVKLDESHYFFTLRVPGSEERDGGEDMELLNYGVTFASKGQEGLLRDFEKVLESYSAFSVKEVKDTGNWELIDGNLAGEISPEELEGKKELMEESSAAYWTVLAPNVEDYSGCVARMIAAGSGQLIKGILWCGDVTVDRLKWGDEFFKKRMGKSGDMEISPGTMRRMKRYGF